MMKIDIKNHYPTGPLVDKCLRGNRGIINKAISAIHITGGVMTRWTAQGEGFVGTTCNACLCSEGDISTGACGFPGAV